MSTSGSGRRTPSRGSRPAGRGGPGRTRSARPRTTPARPTPAASLPRPRLTSRAAILVLVVAALAVSYSSIVRAYLPQRDHIAELQRSNAAKVVHNEELRQELKRQSTDEYVVQQLRELGFVYPGETPYVVLDGGKALDVEATLSDPSTVDPAEPQAWWDDAWATMKVAGDPPSRTDPLPQTTIKDPEGAPTEESEESGE